jgi:hypothetical protein
MTCLTLIIGFTAIFFTAQSVVDLQVAEILCGIVSKLLLDEEEPQTDVCSRGESSKR